MKKAIVTESGRIIVQDTSIPTPAPGEVLIKVDTVGICGSDIHIFYGQMGNDRFPLVQGHEMSGTIVDANGSTFLNNGDKVTMLSYDFCGECNTCVSGNIQHCSMRIIRGVNIDGCAAEYVALPEKIVVKLPDNMSFEEGAMIEPLAVAVHACNISNNLRDKKVLVVGAGVIGNLVAQIARIKGADVIITNRSEYRLEFARQVGIENVFSNEDPNLYTKIFAAFNQEGADIVFECIGTANSVNQSFDLCRRMGTVIILGVFGEKPQADFFALQNKELTVKGSALYTLDDFNEAISLVHKKKVQLKPIMTGEYSLERFADAYDAIRKRSYPIMKVLLRI